MSARTVVWVTAVAPVGETTRLPRLGFRGLINLSSNAGSRWARPSSVSECRGQISLRSPNVACRDLAALSQVILQLRGISSSLCGRCCWSALTRRTSDWGVGRYGESVPLLHINRTLGQKRTPPVSTGLQAIDSEILMKSCPTIDGAMSGKTLASAVPGAWFWWTASNQRGQLKY
jgi:hypothetical protein